MRANLSKHKGFTLLEFIIGMAIMGVISSISVSAYSGYIEASKTSQAVIQIRALSFLIDDYALEYGEYPTSLRDIQNENLTDPWGNPYAYLNLHSSNRENHNSDDADNDDDEHGGSGGEENSSGNSDSDGYSSSRDSHGENDEHSERNEHSERDDDDDDDRSEHGSSDGHGDREEREERNRINTGSARKDGNLVPINTNYDLCSHGKDGKSKAPLRAKDSLDDIIYANDGGYIGLAEEF